MSQARQNTHGTRPRNYVYANSTHNNNNPSTNNIQGHDEPISSASRCTPRIEKARNTAVGQQTRLLGDLWPLVYSPSPPQECSRTFHINRIRKYSTDRDKRQGTRLRSHSQSSVFLKYELLQVCLYRQYRRTAAALETFT